MRDKTIVLATILAALMLTSIALLPAQAFIYPDGSEDNTFEIYGPHIDRILIKKYATLQAEVDALVAGEIDITDWALTKSQQDALNVNPDVFVKGYGGEAGYYTFDFNVNNDPTLGDPSDPSYPYANPENPNPEGNENPTSNLYLRQALSHLIDREFLAAGPGQGLYDPIYTNIPKYMAAWIHPDIAPGQPAEALTYPPSNASAAAILNANGFPMAGSTDGYRYWDRNSNGAEDAGEHLVLDIVTRTLPTERSGAGDLLIAGLNDASIKIHYTLLQTTGGIAWEKVMVNKDFNMYTSGWIFIGPDPDFLYDLYNGLNYWHPTDPPNYGGFNDTITNSASAGIKYATSAAGALTSALLFQERFAELAYGIPLGSTSSPKAYHKNYVGTGAIDGQEDAYEGAAWTHLVNQKGQGENSWYSTFNMYPVGHPTGDGTMTVRYGWSDNTMTQTLNPMYSSWYWEAEVYGRIYDSLAGRNPYTLGPFEVPFLANNWTIRSVAGKSVVTAIARSDITWSDGTKFTADDIIYTFITLPAELEAKGAPPPWWQPTVDQIEDFVRVDQYTVDIYLTVESFWAMGWIVGNVIVPKHILSPFIATHTVAEISSTLPAATLVGTGPFKFVSEDASTVVMTVNPTYYQRQSVANINTDPTSGVVIASVGASDTILTPYRVDPGAETDTADVNLGIAISNLDQINPVTVDLTVEVRDSSGTLKASLSHPGEVLAFGGVHSTSLAVNGIGKGRYAVTVTMTWAGPTTRTTTTYFYVGEAGAIRADVNFDGIVNIFDITTVALAFGATLNPLTPNWNPAADLNFDGIVNIFDIVTIALSFGWPA